MAVEGHKREREDHRAERHHGRDQPVFGAKRTQVQEQESFHGLSWCIVRYRRSQTACCGGWQAEPVRPWKLLDARG
jgi:hypothetical protein